MNLFLEIWGIFLCVLPVFFTPVTLLSLLPLIGGVILLSLSYKKRKEEKYDYITGKLVSGTVYANNPENTPGLGWIL